MSSSAPYSKTPFGLFFSPLSVSDRVSHPYKAKCIVAVLCILIFIFLDSKLEDKKILHRMIALPAIYVLLISFWMGFWFMGG